MKYQQVLPLDNSMRVKDQFGWLPLSVINPSQGKKGVWIQAYLDDNIEELRRSKKAKYLPGLKFSEFNAGLAENIIRYWSVEDALVIDPFAGRATRAVVTTLLNRRYIGYEISPQTYKRVIKHFKKLKIKPQIYLGDGIEMKKSPNNCADLVFTCPPYHRLERYESVDNQLSDIKEYALFLRAINECAKNIYRVLKSTGFVCWVCADWRDGKEFRLFHYDSIRIFQENGFKVHDIMVIKNQSPFAALQAGKVGAKRYTSKIHEYLIVFKKMELGL